MVLYRVDYFFFFFAKKKVIIFLVKYSDYLLFLSYIIIRTIIYLM